MVDNNVKDNCVEKIHTPKPIVKWVGGKHK